MAGTWIAHIIDGETHLTPIGDVIQHLLHADCICGPTLTDGEYLHHTLNGMICGTPDS